jgi:hypothetical protein
MSREPTFTVKDVVAAQKAMREALGLPPEEFQLRSLVRMVSDEIERLRRQGLSNDRIASLITSATGITVSGESIERYYASPQERER